MERNMRCDGTMTIDETADLMAQGERIRSACFFDGDEDQWIVQFFRLSGSIARASYNRHAPGVQVTFVPVDSWEYDMLVKMHEAEVHCYVI